jgi:hypothetical protein
MLIQLGLESKSNQILKREVERKKTEVKIKINVFFSDEQRYREMSSGDL